MLLLFEQVKAKTGHWPRTRMQFCTRARRMAQHIVISRCFPISRCFRTAFYNTQGYKQKSTSLFARCVRKQKCLLAENSGFYQCSPINCLSRRGGRLMGGGGGIYRVRSCKQAVAHILLRRSQPPRHRHIYLRGQPALISSLPLPPQRHLSPIAQNTSGQSDQFPRPYIGRRNLNEH